MTTPTPSSTRDFFELFQQYDDVQGVAGLVDSVDWRGVLPHQIYWLILQRLPEAARVARIRPEYSAKTYVEGGLLGAEFQRSIIQLVANAYPEKIRLIHIHIPKTAGLDLKDKLATKLPALPIHLSQNEITSSLTLFAALKDITNKLAHSESLYIGGHRELSWYLKHSLYRYGDRLFAVVRHPHDIVISFINFILGRFVSDPQLTRYDTRDWAGVIGLEKLPDFSKPDNIIQVASKLLLTRTTTIRSNFLATYLGHGTAESALELMARTNIEITDITRYSRWLKETWGIDSNTRINRSVQYINFDTFSVDQRDYIRELCEQDMLLYSNVMKSLEGKSAPHVFGAEIYA